MSTAKDKIDAGEWAECWVCDEVFREKRQTARYCKLCEGGFCREHGSFAYGGFGTCLRCGWK